MFFSASGAPGDYKRFGSFLFINLLIRSLFYSYVYEYMNARIYAFMFIYLSLRLFIHLFTNPTAMHS